MNIILNALQFLQGKKSYISAVALFIIGGLFFVGVLTQEQANALALMVGGVGVASLRSALNKPQN